MKGTDFSRASFGWRALLVGLTLAATHARAGAQSGYGGAPASRVARAGSMSGRVHRAAGEPLAGVVVRLERAGRATGAAFQRSDTTSVSGRFTFANVPAGSYVLTLERDSLVSRRLSVSVQDRAATFDIVMTASHEAQSAEELKPVVVTAKSAPAPTLIGSLPDIRGTEIFAGKKTETIQVDSLPMNSAQDVSRQLFARTPGANI